MSLKKLIKESVDAIREHPEPEEFFALAFVLILGCITVSVVLPRAGYNQGSVTGIVICLDIILGLEAVVMTWLGVIAWKSRRRQERESS